MFRLGMLGINFVFVFDEYYSNKKMYNIMSVQSKLKIVRIIIIIITIIIIIKNNK